MFGRSYLLLSIIFLIGSVTAVCPTDGCLLGNSTFPSLGATLSNGILTLTASSYGGSFLYIGSDTSQPYGDGCPALTASGNASTSTTCGRQLQYTFDWATITSAGCSGQQLVSSSGDTITRSLRVYVVDDVISGEVFGQQQCTNTFHVFTVQFVFPTTATFNSTVEIFSSFSEAHAFINGVSHNVETDTTTANLIVGLSYPYQLLNASGTTLLSPSGYSATLTPLTTSASCNGNIDSICYYTLQFDVLGQPACGSQSPFTTYEFAYNIALRSNTPGPVIENSTYSLAFTIPDLVSCTPQVYTAQVTLNPQTYFVDLSTGSRTPTTKFDFQQPITLEIPVSVDFATPESGRLDYIRVCEKATSALALSDPCSNFESIQYSSGYTTSSEFVLVSDASYANTFALSPSQQTLNVTFYLNSLSTVGSAAAPSATSHIRIEIKVAELKFANDAKKKKSLDSTDGSESNGYEAMSSLAIQLQSHKPQPSNRRKVPGGTEQALTTSNMNLTVIAVCAVVMAIVYVSRNSKRSSKLEHTSTKPTAQQYSQVSFEA